MVRMSENKINKNSFLRIAAIANTSTTTKKRARKKYRNPEKYTFSRNIFSFSVYVPVCARHFSLSPCMQKWKLKQTSCCIWCVQCVTFALCNMLCYIIIIGYFSDKFLLFIFNAFFSSHFCWLIAYTVFSVQYCSLDSNLWHFHCIRKYPTPG